MTQFNVQPNFGHQKLQFKIHRYQSINSLLSINNSGSIMYIIKTCYISYVSNKFFIYTVIWQQYYFMSYKIMTFTHASGLQFIHNSLIKKILFYIYTLLTPGNYMIFTLTHSLKLQQEFFIKGVISLTLPLLCFVGFLSHPSNINKWIWNVTSFCSFYTALPRFILRKKPNIFVLLSLCFHT